MDFEIVDFENCYMTVAERDAILRVRELHLPPSMVFPELDTRAPFQPAWARVTRHAPFGHAAHRRGTVSHLVRKVDLYFRENVAHYRVEWMCGGTSTRFLLTHEPAEHLLGCVRCEDALARDRSRETAQVYFAQARTTGQIKIGFSIDVSRRIRQIRPLSDLLATVDGGRTVEREMHDRFDHLRVAGEWFSPGDDLLEFIGSLNEAAA